MTMQNKTVNRKKPKLQYTRTYLCPSSPVGQERVVDKIINDGMPGFEVDFGLDFDPHFLHRAKFQAILYVKSVDRVVLKVGICSDDSQTLLLARLNDDLNKTSKLSLSIPRITITLS